MRAIFLETEKKNTVYYFGPNGVQVPCDLDYPPIHFMFDKTWLTVDPADYVVPMNPGSACLLLLTEGELPFLVMGLPLFVGYYTVHDDKKGRMGFVPHATSSKTGPYWATSLPSADLTKAKERYDYTDLSNHESQMGDSEKLEEEVESLETWIVRGAVIIFFLLVCILYLASSGSE